MSLNNVYYENRDMRLLLDLLAATSGTAASLRILAILDEGFRMNAEPTVQLPITRIEGPNTTDSVVVQLTSEAVIASCVRGNVGDCAYIVEIGPTTTVKNAIQTLKLGTEMKAEFCGLEPTKEYDICVRTIVDGETIACRQETICPRPE